MAEKQCGQGAADFANEFNNHGLHRAADKLDCDGRECKIVYI